MKPMTESITTDGSYIVARIGLGDATHFDKMSEAAYRIEGENSMLVNPDNPISLFEKGFTESEAISRAAFLNAQRVHEINLGVAASVRKTLGSSEDVSSFGGGSGSISSNKELQTERHAA
jgi:hypothetical protein